MAGRLGGTRHFFVRLAGSAVEIRTDGWLEWAGCSSVLHMKLTDHRIISGVAVAIPALAMIGFGLGVLQGQRPPTEPQPLPIPTSMG